MVQRSTRDRNPLTAVAPPPWSGAAGAVRGALVWSLALVVALVLLGLAAPPVRALDAATYAKAPRLILLLVVDQLRADYPTRVYERLGAGAARGGQGRGKRARVRHGIRWLIEQGAWFPHTDHRTLNAMTGPGHATISTGAWPVRHGIVLNAWWDRERKDTHYCVQDDSLDPVGPPAGTGALPRSPALLEVPSLSDAVKAADPGARVVSISMKDRAAILMGGRGADHALWLDRARKQWMTSTWYERSGRLPSWVEEVNRKHALVAESLAGPASVEMTTDLAIAAIDAMKLGSHDRDVLAVSYSALDIVGHSLGPGDPAMDSLFVAHDQELGRLLEHVRKSLPGGLEDAIVVLTGDHGAPPHDDHLQRARQPHARIADAQVGVEIDRVLKQALGAPPGDLGFVSWTYKHHVWLDEDVLRSGKHDPARARRIARDHLRGMRGIAAAFTRDDVATGQLPAGLLGELAAVSHRPGRSGDVVAIAQPYVSTPNEPVIHMGPWAYDRMVPLFVAGRSIRAGVYGTAAQIVDIAATVAFLAGIVPPAACEGRVLHEALEP